MRSFTAPLVVAASFATALCMEGYAMPARSTAMSVNPSPESAIEAHANDFRRFAVTNVEGGRGTTALGSSNVANEDLRSALEHSLRAACYLAEDSAAATIDLCASIVRVDRPSFAFTTTVTSVVRYRTVARETGTTLVDTTIEAKGSAGVSDAFLGPKRLRLAGEASIRANIACFLKVLRAREPAAEIRREAASGVAGRIDRCDD